jgi:hypothetical protein
VAFAVHWKEEEIMQYMSGLKIEKAVFNLQHEHTKHIASTVAHPTEATTCILGPSTVMKTLHEHTAE